MKQNALTLTKDLLRLLDLQIQLLAFDIGDFWKRSRFGIAFLVFGGAMLLAALPVLFLGLAELLRSAFEMSVEASQLTVGGIALVIGGVILLVGIRQFTQALRCLERSREELKTNLDWMRSVLSRDEE